MRRPFSRIRVEDEPRPRSEAVEAPLEKLPSVMSTEEPEPKAGIECSRSCTVLAPVAAICLALITSTGEVPSFSARLMFEPVMVTLVIGWADSWACTNWDEASVKATATTLCLSKNVCFKKFPLDDFYGSPHICLDKHDKCCKYDAARESHMCMSRVNISEEKKRLFDSECCLYEHQLYGN